MDDLVLWEGKVEEFEVKVEQLLGKFAEWGLRPNLKKCSLYLSPKHQGRPYITIAGTKIPAEKCMTIIYGS